jgi:SAM-dependent methyltransferase
MRTNEKRSDGLDPAAGTATPGEGDDSNTFRAFMYTRYAESHATYGGGADFSLRSDFKARTRRDIERYLPADQQAVIVDIGCGSGQFVAALRRHGYRAVTGIDASADQVELAKRLGIDAIELGTGLDYLERQPDASVDCFWLFDVIEHLTRRELLSWLRAMLRVLKPGGRIVAHLPNSAGLMGAHIAFGDITHETFLNETSCRQLFTAVGYESVRIDDDPPLPHGFKSRCRAWLWSCIVLIAKAVMLVQCGYAGGTWTSCMYVIAFKPSERPSATP